MKMKIESGDKVLQYSDTLLCHRRHRMYRSL